MLDQATINEIKARMDIVEVISDFVSLKKAGTNYKALSPFTNERTPSFFVSPSKEIFKCFSSGKGGDAISFIMEVEGIGYLEALKYLAKKYGIEVKETEYTDEELVERNERESLYIVLKYAASYYEDLLWNHEEGRSIGLSYFRERGFTDKVIKDFNLGYSLQSWDGLLTTAKKQGHSVDLLEKAGLIIRKDDGKTEGYDRFRARVIFPIHDVSGRPLAFGARTLSKDKKQPKYINSPETAVYHKSDVLYGLAQAKQAIRNDDNCYLVEGYTDVISLHMSGVPNVVASSGTSLTEAQIRLIGRFSENVTVLFDGDTAGIKASLRGIDMILEQGLNVRAVVFPEGEDPDSYSQKLGSEAFKAYLKENARDFISFKASLFAKETAGDPIRRAEMISDIVLSISKVPDPVKRSVYMQETSRLLDMEEAVLITELNKILIRERRDKERKQQYDRDRGDIAGIPLPEYPEEGMLPPEADPEPELPTSEQRIKLQEREAVRLLLIYGLNEVEGDDGQFPLHEFILNELESIPFLTPVYQDILKKYREAVAGGQAPDSHHLVTVGEEKVKNEIADLILDRHTLSKNWETQFQIYTTTEQERLGQAVSDNLARLMYHNLDHLIEVNRNKLKESGEED
ncbi:MAG: DNA primase [Cyclobacteriaceae bacterium]